MCVSRRVCEGGCEWTKRAEIGCWSGNWVEIRAVCSWVIAPSGAITGEATLSATDFWAGFWTLYWGPIQGWIFHRSAYKPASFQQHIETQAGFVTIEVHLPNLR